MLLRLFGQIHEKILEKTLKIHHLDPNSMWLLFRVSIIKKINIFKVLDDFPLRKQKFHFFQDFVVGCHNCGFNMQLLIFYLRNFACLRKNLGF